MRAFRHLMSNEDNFNYTRLRLFPDQELGNRIEKSKQSELLQEILTPATIMVVSVTASTTQGWVLVTTLGEQRQFICWVTELARFE